MKKLSRGMFIWAAFSVFSLLAISCASTPQNDPALPAIEITIASPDEIRQFGIKQGENPYLEPTSLLKGKLNEFLILKIHFNLMERSKVSIIAQSMKEDGSEAGRFYTAKDFAAFWDQRDIYTEDENPYGNTKLITIQRSCLPSLDFFQNSGARDYYLPLVSSYPIPRPAKIYVQVAPSSGESVVFNYLLE
ncbi:MAG: hypothetical protein ACYC1A_03955 [Spirochaetales bacterium]